MSSVIDISQLLFLTLGLAPDSEEVPKRVPAFLLFTGGICRVLKTCNCSYVPSYHLNRTTAYQSGKQAADSPDSNKRTSCHTNLEAKSNNFITYIGINLFPDNNWTFHAFLLWILDGRALSRSSLMVKNASGVPEYCRNGGFFYDFNMEEATLNLPKIKINFSVSCFA